MTVATCRNRPLSDPSIDAVCHAAHQFHAFPVPVFDLKHGTICEIAIWQRGEWVGSAFRWPTGGLGAWSSIGNTELAAPSHGTAVQIALGGTDFRQVQRANNAADGDKR